MAAEGEMVKCVGGAEAGGWGSIGTVMLGVTAEEAHVFCSTPSLEFLLPDASHRSFDEGGLFSELGPRPAGKWYGYVCSIGATAGLWALWGFCCAASGRGTFWNWLAVAFLSAAICPVPGGRVILQSGEVKLEERNNVEHWKPGGRLMTEGAGVLFFLFRPIPP